LSLVFAVKVQIGKETRVAEEIAYKAQARNIPLKAILALPDISGYIFIEAESDRDIINAWQGVRGIRTSHPYLIDFEELLPHLKKKEVKFNEKDVVEVTKGPFKGFKGVVSGFKNGLVKVKLLDLPSNMSLSLSKLWLKRVGDEKVFKDLQKTFTYAHRQRRKGKWRRK